MGKKSCWESLPETFLVRLEQMIPSKISFRRSLESFCRKKPTTFRANTLKISSDELVVQLTKRGIEFERVSWYQDAFIISPLDGALQQTAYARLMESDLYKNGFLYVQSLSSMIPPIVLDAKPGENILDIAAAPGSKTTQMAAMMHNTGSILANDTSHVRVYKLKANLALQGVTNTDVTQKHGQILWRQYPDHFEKALVDVPCSMEGRFVSDDAKTYADWSVRKIKEMVQTQRFLLRSAVSAVKPGGLIVYATCTMAPEENEGVIDWILKKEKKRVEVLPIHFPQYNSRKHPAALQAFFLPGLTRWNEKIYDSSVSLSLRILPTDTMEAFYIALLKKCHSL